MLSEVVSSGGLFGGISLFIIGLVDLVFALVGLRSKSL
jgi:hypothetical protein